MRGREAKPPSHCGREDKTEDSEAVLTCSEPLMRSPSEGAGALNKITHNPCGSQSSCAGNNAQWNDDPAVECLADFAGVQVHLCLKE